MKIHKYNVLFEIESRGPKDQYKILVDNSGYICGVFASYKDAKIAIPKIRRNMIKEFDRREKIGKLIPIEFVNT